MLYFFSPTLCQNSSLILTIVAPTFDLATLYIVLPLNLESILVNSHHEPMSLPLDIFYTASSKANTPLQFLLFLWHIIMSLINLAFKPYLIYHIYVYNFDHNTSIFDSSLANFSPIPIRQFVHINKSVPPL